MDEEQRPRLAAQNLPITTILAIANDCVDIQRWTAYVTGQRILIPPALYQGRAVQEVPLYTQTVVKAVSTLLRPCHGMRISGVCFSVKYSPQACP